MKFNTWLISAGICCTLLIGCNQPQKQEATTTTKSDDIIWKANLSYCLTTEKPNWRELRDGQELENIEIYNFKITEQNGKFKDLIRMFYDSAHSKNHPVYAMNPVTGLSPDIQLNQNEKLMTFNDSVWNDDHTKATVIPDVFICMKGITFNHEWLYDTKAGSLKSTITDLSLLARGMPNSGSALLSLAAFKFSNRAIDTLGTEQSQLSSNIAWGRNVLMPIIDSGQGPKLRTEEHWVSMDSASKYTVNGISSSSFLLYPTQIKTTFNKKLVEWIWESASKGQLQVYACSGEDKIGDLIPAKDIKEYGAAIDTLMSHDGKFRTMKQEIGEWSLSGLELKEEIAFHKSTFNFESRITYAGILVNVLDNNGRLVPNTSKVLYWVKLN